MLNGQSAGIYPIKLLLFHFHKKPASEHAGVDGKIK